MRPLASPSLQREDGVGCVDAVEERGSDERGDQADCGGQERDGIVDERVVSDLVESVSRYLGKRYERRGFVLRRSCLQ